MSLLDEKKVLLGLGKVDVSFCEHCIMEKQHRKTFGVETHSSKEILEYVHSDLWEHSLVASLFGKLYYVSFLDDYSKYMWAYFLTQKSEVFSTFKSWRIQVETQTRYKVKYLRSDNGGKYTSEEFHRYCREKWILCHFITVYTPQQNVVSERLNRTVLEKVLSMLSESGLTEEF